MAKNIYAPNPRVPDIMGGVINPMMKLFSQFEVVDKATPFALIELGKISDGIAHGTGPIGSQHVLEPLIKFNLGRAQRWQCDDNVEMPTQVIPTP